MYVAAGAHAALLKGERERFLENEWPRIQATIQRLGFNAAELLATPPAAPDSRPSTPAAGASAPSAAADDSTTK